MLIRTILIRSNSYRRFLFSDSNINGYNFTLVKIRNCSTNLIDKRKPYLSNHQNGLQYSSLQHLNIRVTVRNKGTESSTSTASKENTIVEEASKEKIIIPLTTGEKLKKAVKEYGSTVIVFHVGISLISLGSCYLLVTSGLDITKVFTALGLNEWVTKSQIASSAGTFAVAYAVHKVFAPVRITITLASVPLIVRYLRKIGFLKK